MKSTPGLFLAAALAASLPPGLASAQDAPPELTVDLGSGVSLDLVLIKAGKFSQGSPATEPGRSDDETRREVTITKDFYIGRYEVTVSQFERFVAATGYKSEAEKGTSGGFGWNGQALEQRPSFNWKNPGFPQSEGHPVTIVTYDDAMAFARWVSQKAGRPTTLPTEAQWEFAARAKSSSIYPASGARTPSPESLGWFKANASGGTHAVGEKAANGMGLFDMAGNVAEWCLDWYGPYDPAATTDPVEVRSNLGDKPRRVLRGGSWLRDPKNGRSAARYRSTPGSRNADNGFRVAAAVAGAPLTVPVAASAALKTTPGASESEGLSGWGALALFVGFLALPLGFIALIIRIARRKLLAGFTNVRTEVNSDGFTFKAPPEKLGHRIHYRYMVDGRSQTGSVVYAGDSDTGQVVYTGDRPSSVQIVAVTAPGQSLPAPKAKPAPPQRAVSRTDDDSFRGYPSAYR